MPADRRSRVSRGRLLGDKRRSAWRAGNALEPRLFLTIGTRPKTTQGSTAGASERLQLRVLSALFSEIGLKNREARVKSFHLLRSGFQRERLINAIFYKRFL